MSALYQKHVSCLSISQSSVDYAAVDGVDSNKARSVVGPRDTVEIRNRSEEIPCRNQERASASVLFRNACIAEAYIFNGDNALCVCVFYGDHFLKNLLHFTERDKRGIFGNIFKN